ncbi:hypothetical protein Tco_1578875, partial [Tanacetum coccineum]
GIAKVAFGPCEVGFDVGLRENDVLSVGA